VRAARLDAKRLSFAGREKSVSREKYRRRVTNEDKGAITRHAAFTVFRFPVRGTLPGKTRGAKRHGKTPEG